MNQQADGHKEDAGVIQWCIAVGDDGLSVDCILVALLDGQEMQSVSLHVQPKHE
jgi:hypothetical protein